MGTRAPLLVLILPVVLAAMFYGARSALLLTFLGVITVAYILGLGRGGAYDFLAQMQICMFLSVGLTISWFGRKHDKIQKKLAAMALETHKRNDEILALLGHELRNPLSGISSAAGLLTRPGQDHHSIEKSAKIIQRQAAYMTNMMADMLDISRVRRGQLESHKVSVNLVSVMHSAVEQLSALVDQREQRIVLNLPASPVWVLGNETRLVQVIANLLANASLYTPHKGLLTLTLSTTQDQAQMSVQDNGIGITPEMAVSVFDLFTQAKRSTNGVMGGLGLGLALVKSVVEAHGGKVSVYSSGLSHGSTFGVTLPLIKAPHAAAQKSISPPALPNLVQPDRLANPVADGQSLDILLVEDNQDAAQTLAMMLEFSGHRVVIAYNGKEALQQAQDKRFDAAILDIGLPDTDGYTLARKFRAMPHLATTRLVAVTGYGSAEDKAKAREAGFDQHITKPIIDCDMLIAALQPVGQRVAPALTS